MQNREGQKVPQVTFRTRADGDWKEIHSDDIFKGRSVVLFALPGAFTPTRSSTHLPRYNELAPVFRENGIDEIVCLSVNDAFVMDAWKEDQEAENVTLIPDGNGEFSEGMDMLVDKSDLGFGKRSWRYAMLVRDGVIEKMFLEPDEPGDPFEVSDADTMLAYINPNARKPRSVSIITKPGCAPTAPVPRPCWRSTACPTRRSCSVTMPASAARVPLPARRPCPRCSSTVNTSVDSRIWRPG